MKYLAFLGVLVLLLPALSGCVAEEEEVKLPGFEWPDKIEIPCNSNLKDGLVCEEYLTGFVIPVVGLHHPQESEIWIADLSGVISAWDGESQRVVVNMTDLVSLCHLEQGLLSFVFAEDFNTSKKVLLSYVEEGSCEGPNQSKLILADALVENGQINVSKIRPLREVPQPYRNHNGGHLLGIGNNQYLWGLGDGGSSNDPNQTSQNLSSPLGAIHLIEYKNGYVSPVLDDPSRNPYILHHGLRNPWRFDVDPSGGLWIADVGQKCFEELNYVPLHEPHNLGWSMREGFHEFNESAECGSTPVNSDSNYTDPVAVYPHEGGNCSISGGEWMDWGPEPLRDGYLYGDFCTGTIWLITGTLGNWSTEIIAQTGTMIVGFGHSLDDELLIFSWAGTIYVLKDD